MAAARNILIIFAADAYHMICCRWPCRVAGRLSWCVCVCRFVNLSFLSSAIMLNHKNDSRERANVGTKKAALPRLEGIKSHGHGGYYLDRFVSYL